MKKKILGGLAVFAIAIVAAFNVNINMQDDGLSSISLDNVEALAGGEIIVGPLCAHVCTYCWCIYFEPYEEYEGRIVM